MLPLYVDYIIAEQIEFNIKNSTNKELDNVLIHPVESTSNKLFEAI
jgi:hypothetical protein